MRVLVRYSSDIDFFVLPGCSFCNVPFDGEESFQRLFAAAVGVCCPGWRFSAPNFSSINLHGDVVGASDFIVVSIAIAFKQYALRHIVDEKNKKRGPSTQPCGTPL